MFDLSLNADEIKSLLSDVVFSITEKAVNGGIVCPICHSGKGKNKTGAFSITKDGRHWECFACQRGGDVLDLVGEYYKITSKVEQLQKLNEICNTDFSFRGNHPPRAVQTSKKAAEPAAAEKEADYSEYFAACAARLEETDYHRGISLETLQRYGVGYDPAWRHPKAPETVPTTPRLIIPTSKGSYLARDTRDNIPEPQKTYTKSKAGKVKIFSLEAASEGCFIVEGEIDAMSIVDCGGRAVGLGSVSNVGMFLEHVKQQPPAKGSRYIIALDDDDRGREAAQKLEYGLSELNVPFYRATALPGAKDCNELLMRDRPGLAAWIRKQQEAAAAVAALDRGENNGIKVIDNLLTADVYRERYFADKILVQGFARGISESVNTPVISTGFVALDETLDGGLYEGLYVVGGVSSLGKTSFVMQIVDQVAQGGHDVLVFTLEMSQNELIAKSLSRLTMQLLQKQGKRLTNAKTPRGITDAKRYANYTKQDTDIIDAAFECYSKYGGHIAMREGVGNIGFREVVKSVRQHISLTGNIPVVVIDYLQILAPADVRASDKQNTDKAVLELKRLSRDLKTPVICISSLNRASYSNKISMEAFKESGAIEYSSDVLLGLQFAGAGEVTFDIDRARNGDRNTGEREIECVVLKNRYGRSGGTIAYKYDPRFNNFQEGSQTTLHRNKAMNMDKATKEELEAMFAD